MKKYYLLLIPITLLVLSGCSKTENINCEILTAEECNENQKCKMCGKTWASSSLDCHSKEFCKYMPHE